MHPTSSTSFLQSTIRPALVAAATAALVAGCASAPPGPASQPPGSTASQRPATAPAPAAPDAAALEQQRFAKWVADFRATARASGIREATLQSAFDQVQFFRA